MFRLAHLSDVHLGPLPEVKYHQLASKRVLGYINWHRNRRRFLHGNMIDAIVADIKAEKPDHIAITGDLVNLALDTEIEMAKQWLGLLGDPHDISVVPGNHDAYVPGAFDKVCRAWTPWMSSDDCASPVNRRSFPYMRIRGNVALVGVSSARATAPFMATGFFREHQAQRLATLLDKAGESGLFRVVMIHHPPLRGAVSSQKRLFGIQRFQNVVRQHGAELILHGHSHLPTAGSVEGPNGRAVPVIGVAAASQSPGGHTPAAQFNLLEISGTPANWSVRLTRRGMTGMGLHPGEISSLDLYPAPITS